MTEIRLGCSGCGEYLTVEVEDDEGPWSEPDAAALDKAATAAGWLAVIEWGDSAYVYCPDHRSEAVRA